MQDKILNVVLGFLVLAVSTLIGGILFFGYKDAVKSHEQCGYYGGCNERVRNVHVEVKQ